MRDVGFISIATNSAQRNSSTEMQLVRSDMTGVTVRADKHS